MKRFVKRLVISTLAIAVLLAVTNQSYAQRRVIIRGNNNSVALSKGFTGTASAAAITSGRHVSSAAIVGGGGIASVSYNHVGASNFAFRQRFNNFSYVERFNYVPTYSYPIYSPIYIAPPAYYYVPPVYSAPACSAPTYCAPAPVQAPELIEEVVTTTTRTYRRP